MSTAYDCDLLVVGGGSGGYGAALAAARRGLSVLVVESTHSLGGNSTAAGVNTWEPGIGGPGFHEELFCRLSSMPQAVCISRTTKDWSQEKPWSLSQPCEDAAYRDTLRRSGLRSSSLRRVTFEPDLMASVMRQTLDETGMVQIWFGAAFEGAETHGDRIKSVSISTPQGAKRVNPAFVVDCTGQIVVARAIGCATRVGSEAQAEFGEPHAGEVTGGTLNGVSICFRVTHAGERVLDAFPEGMPRDLRAASLSITQYPNADLNINPLPLMEGDEFAELGYAAGKAECLKRVRQVWHWMQLEQGFDRYRLKQIFPTVGIREGPRLVGRRVLTEIDVRGGCSSGKDWITLADHPLDVHGNQHLCRELDEPYGVPWECLLTREYSNVAVACRGASFTHIAAASCRLSRTMMQLGHAVGAGVAVAGNRGLPEIDVAEIRAELARDNVALADTDSRFRQVPRVQASVRATASQAVGAA